jgi:hypothetical protein
MRKTILEHFNDFNKNNEYELISLEKGKVIYRHTICQTLIEKSNQHFRVRPNCSNKDCQNKNRKETIKLKYGKENISQLYEVKEKKKEKFNKDEASERLKLNNPMKNKECVEKAKITNTKKYLSSINYEFSEPLFESFLGNRYNKSYIKYEWKCKKCGNIFEATNKNEPLCPKCFLRNISTEEKQIRDILPNTITSEYNKRFYYDGKKFHELDIYIPENKLGIELNGIYWHSEVSGNKDKNYHINKLNFLNKEEIFLFQFFDSEWNNKQEIVKSMINNKLNIFTEKIRASKCIIKEVNSEEINSFLNNNHLQGFINSSINIGLFYNNELVSLLNMGKSRFDKKHEYEIYRFSNKLNTRIYGSFSKLLKYFINKYNSTSIITYADRRYSEGNLYLKNGFKLLHISKPNYYYTKDHKQLESRNKYQKHKLKDILQKFNPTLTEWDNMQLNDYDRIWDCGNYVFSFENIPK